MILGGPSSSMTNNNSPVMLSMEIGFPIDFTATTSILKPSTTYTNTDFPLHQPPLMNYTGRRWGNYLTVMAAKLITIR